ncbi:MAG TPA: GxxExxY protein, partial [Gammaproteobacteria bacterium]|nr:GxxExxY protein [Gammaproteobacteria bacterium]
MEKTISEQVLNCAFEVSNQLGSGFLESVYENALCIEMQAQGIEFQRQKSIDVIYKGQIAGNYVADIVVENKLL